MKIKLSIVVTICLMLSFTRSVAQDQDDEITYKDYFINLKNDTVKCQVLKFKGPDSNLKMKYRIAEGHPALIMQVDSIKELYIGKDSIIYVHKFLPNLGKNAFLERLEHGPINLYQFLREGFNGLSYSNSTMWYANKGDDTLKLIKTSILAINTYHIGSHKEREKAYMELLADNPDLLARYKEARKNADDGFDLIRYYIRTYNDEYLENHKTSK